jgi:hypothetical protein
MQTLTQKCRSHSGRNSRSRWPIFVCDVFNCPRQTHMWSFINLYTISALNDFDIFALTFVFRSNVDKLLGPGWWNFTCEFVEQIKNMKSKNAHITQKQRYLYRSNWCWMPNEQYFKYIMMRTNYISMRWWWCVLCTRSNTTCWFF